MKELRAALYPSGKKDRAMELLQKKNEAKMRRDAKKEAQLELGLTLIASVRNRLREYNVQEGPCVLAWHPPTPASLARPRHAKQRHRLLCWFPSQRVRYSTPESVMGV